ncbi:uncharacterized protein ARMOST_12620 [Armillaria ostoyae]|uniref:Uncharacterized protein n=2 Tax=Armillaria TaxID=47424 RepID=A0A284RKF9_ARMOS|nr:hypothetical protein EV421DRAFT_1827035 [Armillaria borealis]SJL09243.1 uncharacterized protein ARMOST_12620 [Armillaria ostoyae]
MSETVLPPPKPDLSFTRPPESPAAQYLWRWRMWFEATFVLSMLEPWEKVLLLSILFISSTFFLTAFIRYMPQHLADMQRRAVYYLYGQEGDERLFWQILSKGANGVFGGGRHLKEL